MGRWGEGERGGGGGKSEAGRQRAITNYLNLVLTHTRHPPMRKIRRLRLNVLLQEDIKSLTCYIVEKHYGAFEGVSYVQTFKNLKQRYEQHQDRLKDKTNLER